MAHTVLPSSFPSRGVTEGITLLILAVQTGLIELQVIHRAFLLSIILFIVVASILQSMLEIADPIVLALGASRDKYDAHTHTHTHYFSLTLLQSLIFLSLLVCVCAQEPVEALPCSEPVSVPAHLPCLHGLHDLPVLPHGLLAAHHHLLQHPHFAAGTRAHTHTLTHTHSFKTSHTPGLYNVRILQAQSAIKNKKNYRNLFTPPPPYFLLGAHVLLQKKVCVEPCTNTHLLTHTHLLTLTYSQSLNHIHTHLHSMTKHSNVMPSLYYSNTIVML